VAQTWRVSQTDPPFEALSRFERLAVRLVRRMNSGAWQRFWFVFQREINARWIGLVTGPLLEVHGLDRVERIRRDRPVLLAANHRTFFDLYVVMSVLFLRLRGWRAINFPVRGRYFYQRPGGVALNALCAWWSMYPPFFHQPNKRRFDQWALQELARLCRDRPGQLVGFHPEGTRNKDPDPYSFLAAQPGIGRLIYEAEPRVLPVFVAGLTNSFSDVVRRRLRGGRRIRIWFGDEFDPAPYLSKPDAASTYRALADAVMAEVRCLGEADRAEQARLEAASFSR